MKQLWFFLLLVIFGTSCEKQNVDPKYKNSSFKCQLNGQTFDPLKSPSPQVTPFTVLYCPTGSQGFSKYPPGFLSIQGIDTRYSMSIAGSINIQKLGVFGTGEYPLSYEECDTFNTCDASWHYNTKEWNRTTNAGMYYAESGKLIITKFDSVERRITARFFFEAKDVNGKVLDVSKGEFNLPYTLIKNDGTSDLN